ncbi:MAG: hypothetical protein ILA52_00890 [Alphaproteobacteria bacterium]|nr:hypothetical protein [Alphaproteobacteria bacterium]
MQMKLYHYVTKGNDVLQKGLLSFAKNPNANLRHYFKRTGGKTTHKEICEWMESCFVGRSRAIRGFSEPIQWTERSIHCLKDFIDNADKFEIDISAMDKDGLIEAVYVSPSILDFPDVTEEKGMDEILQKLNSINDIDYSPIDWSVCDDELGRRFAYVRYYLIVLKDGYIPPQYLTLEC